MSLVTALRRPIGAALRLLRSVDERRDLVWELRRRAGREPALPAAPIRRVLVVCYGNICRSPFAERLLARACPGLEVRSAGFAAGQGDPAEPLAIAVAAEFGIDLADHAAHRLDRATADWADLVVGMTGRHHGMVLDRFPDRVERVRLLGDYLPAAPFGLEDPWGRPAEAFRAVYGRIEAANARLAEQLARAADRP